MKKSTCLFGGALMAAGMANVAAAQFTLPSVAGPVNVAAGANSYVPFDATGVPAGTYNYFSVSVDWAAGGGNPWSNEARIALANGDLSTIYQNTFIGADNGATNGNNITLNWTGFFDTTDFNSGDTLQLIATQVYAGSDANWSNLSVTLDFIAPPNLADFALPTVIESGDKVFGNTDNSTDDFTNTSGDAFASGSGEDGGDDIYEINWAGGRMFSRLEFDGAAEDLDLFLYEADGTFIDRAFTLDDPEIIDVTLPAGTYYARVDGFTSGAYSLLVTPAPGAIALFGMAGLAGIRRRRA